MPSNGYRKRSPSRCDTVTLNVAHTENHPAKSLDDIAADYADAFFIDTATATFDGATETLTGVYRAEFFGECRISVRMPSDIEATLAEMGRIASETFERLSTECASHGTFRAGHRPVEAPSGYAVVFTADDAELASPVFS